MVRLKPRQTWSHFRERAVEVGDDVVGVFDANGETQRALVDPESRTLLRRDAAVRRDRRVQHLAEEIAEGGRGRSQLERIEEAERGCLRRVLEIERDDPAEETAELTLRQLVLRMVGETGIADARDLRMRREMRRHAQRAFALTPDVWLEA